MKKKIMFALSILLISTSPACSGVLDEIMDKVDPASKEGSSGPAGKEALSLDQIISGLKEALSIGTGDAVSFLSKTDGYFGNELTRILMPEKIQNVADMLKKVGLGNQVDNFVLTMNRAAENATPQAKEFFIDAIKEMSFNDAKGILYGGDTSATQYLESKTRINIKDAFKPVISSSLDEVGATKAYKDMISSFNSLPFVSSKSLDLDDYVTDKALDGLFIKVGEEEAKIRANPSARVTDILKQVFGG